MILNRSIRSISYNIDTFYLVLKEFCCLWVLSPWIWNVLWVRFSKINLLHQLKKMERWPRDTPKVFLFYFWVENMPSPNIWDWPLNPTLNNRFRRNILRDVLVRIRSIIFFFFLFFLLFMIFFIITRKVLGSLFSIKCFHILNLYLMFNLKQNTIYI